MSGRTKQHPTEQNLYHIVIDGPGKNRLSSWISEEIFVELQAFLAKHSSSGSATWEELATAALRYSLTAAIFR